METVVIELPEFGVFHINEESWLSSVKMYGKPYWNPDKFPCYAWHICTMYNTNGPDEEVFGFVYPTPVA